jgi:hypothetical protein
MNTEIIKKIIAEWLKDKVFPPLIKRDAPDLVLERISEIIENIVKVIPIWKWFFI